ncbi:MAG TPA: hypothetical protein ENN66_02260 [Proteobacteria bacterium]|nr:hypothetical protein [Pseudomonadota bacterium]
MVMVLAAGPACAWLMGGFEAPAAKPKPAALKLRAPGRPDAIFSKKRIIFMGEVYKFSREGAKARRDLKQLRARISDSSLKIDNS